MIPANGAATPASLPAAPVEVGVEEDPAALPMFADTAVAGNGHLLPESGLRPLVARETSNNTDGMVELDWDLVA
ncbi:MAG: hypothetical protein ACRCYU_09615, partial [Nocardioides sp.]